MSVTSDTRADQSILRRPCSPPMRGGRGRTDTAGERLEEISRLDARTRPGRLRRADESVSTGRRLARRPVD